MRRKRGFPGGTVDKSPPANAGDVGSIPGSGRAPGGGHGSPLQYSCLENPMDRGASGLQPMGLQRSLTYLKLLSISCSQGSQALGEEEGIGRENTSGFI